MKKIISILLACIILIGCFSGISVSAENAVVASRATAKITNAASNANHKQVATNTLSKYIDINTFTSLVMSSIKSCKSTVDVDKYKIPLSAQDAFAEYIYYGLPEAFNVSSVYCSYYNSTQLIASIVIEYYPFADTASEYATCKSKMDAGTEELLEGIKGNSKLGVVEKLLLLHDRLALWNTYDYDGLEANIKDNSKKNEIYTAYAALGERKSVCMGYAMAYMHLLNQIGIESYYCSSEDPSINHGWNIVYVNGKKYHVDVTWDDTDYPSEVSHENFLRSSTGMYETGHTVLDFDLSPTDTTYDNYFWQRTHAQFMLVGNEIYYIDNVDQQLKRYSDKKALCNVSWSDWSDNYSRLATDNRSLFYTLSDAVYRFDLSGNTSEKIYAISVGYYEFVAGIEYDGTTLTCYIYDTSTGNMRSVSKKYQHNYGQSQVSGDPNGDYEIDNKDYAVLMQYLNGWDVTIIADNADVNGDGSLDNKDYALLMQYLNGWNVVLK